jgi:hypothetical protein
MNGIYLSFQLPCPDRTGLNLATEYMELNEKDFRALRGYLHDISLSKYHSDLRSIRIRN